MISLGPTPLRRDKLRIVRRREGRYLLRSNLPNEDPATLWQYYIRLTEIEQAFKELKHDLAVRPIYHQTDKRIEAHIFIAFIAYCLHVTLKQRTRSCAPGLTPRAVLEKFATMQMVDVHLPTTDGRQLVLPRYTQPDSDHQLLFQQLKLNLPAQPPRVFASEPPRPLSSARCLVVPTFGLCERKIKTLHAFWPRVAEVGLGVTYKTAWFIFHRLREAMRDGRFSALGGKGKTVEADETFIGKKHDKAKGKASS